MASVMESYSRFVLLVFILATSLAHFASSTSLSEEAMMSEKHEQWMAQHARIYKSKEEKEARFNIFKNNVKFIEDFNRAENQTYKMGLNKFADLTSEEFKSTYASGLRESSSSYSLGSSSRPFMHENINVADLPPSMDWRAMGAVTPVKNQYQCNSCWVFAAVASIEGINKIKTGQLISLSEQEIIDCMGDSCASSGYPEDAYDYVAQSGGIATESSYPFVGSSQEACRADAPAARITTYERVPSYDEVSLQKAVANQPISVGINCDPLQFYTSGVVTTKDYTSSLNHAVSVVGYGTDVGSGVNYWLAKNSWGASWGEYGFFRVQRDSGIREGTLGIATNPTYPVI